MRHGQRNFDNKIIENLKNFFQGHFDAAPPTKNDKPNNHCIDQSQSSGRSRVLFTNCDDTNSSAELKTASSRCSSEQP